MSMTFTFSWPEAERNRINQTLIAHTQIPKDMRPVWQRFFVTLRTRSRTSFDSMTHPVTGAPWTPLLPSYAATKPAGTRRKILYLTGKLRKSLTTAAGAGVIAVSKLREMIYGTAIPYSIYHQSTTRTRKDGASLSRPHVGMRAEDLRKLVAFIRTEMVGAVLRARRK